FVRHLTHGLVTSDLADRYTVAWVIVGAALGAILGGTIGSMQIRGRAKSPAIGLLAGTFLGILACLPLRDGRVLIVMPIAALLGLILGGLYPVLAATRHGDSGRSDAESG